MAAVLMVTDPKEAARKEGARGSASQGKQSLLLGESGFSQRCAAPAAAGIHSQAAGVSAEAAPEAEAWGGRAMESSVKRGWGPRTTRMISVLEAADLLAVHREKLKVKGRGKA